METMNSSASTPLPREPANYDEASLNESLLFSDSLKDLKNLRKQLYSAAEYFELSYTNDDQKQMVVDTLKDYAIKAFVNTVDHLGSVTYKVGDMLDEKANQVSGTELQVSCIQQRVRRCQEYIDREGLSQQSLVINTPKYHKRYILPVAETMEGGNQSESMYERCSSSSPVDDGDESHELKKAVQATIREAPSPPVRKVRSPSPSPQGPQPSQPPKSFSFTDTISKKALVNESEKRTVSPRRFPFSRSGSVSSTTPNSWSTTTKTSRSTTPNPVGRRFPSETQRSASMRLHAERASTKEIEQAPGKGKRLLKALLSRRKSKKDDMLYTYLDEY